MLQLSHIYRKLEKTFGISITRHYNEDQMQTTCQIITKGMTYPTKFYDHSLYLFDHMPILPITSQTNVLLTFVPDPEDQDSYSYFKKTIDAAVVFEQIQQLFLEQMTFLTKKEELIKAVQSDYGVDNLLKSAHMYLDNPIYLCDTSYSILSRCPITKEDLFITTLSTQKEYLSNTLVQELEQHDFTNKMLHTPVPFITTFQQLNNRIVSCPIRIRNYTIGYLIMKELNRDFQENDIEFISMLSQVLSLELQKTYRSKDMSSQRKEAFLEDLLNNVFDNMNIAEQRMAFLDIKPKKYHAIYVLPLPKDNKSQNYTLDHLKHIFKEAIIVCYHNTICILHSTDTSNINDDRSYALLEQFLQANNMQTAVSYPYLNLNHTAAYYEQAVSLLNLGKLMYPEETILTLDTYCFPLLLQEHSHSASLRTYLHPDIKALFVHDGTYGTNYFDTIETYLKCNRNAALAAKALNIHKSTFFYRISKINEIIDFSLEDAQKLLAYELSFLICKHLVMNSLVDEHVIKASKYSRHE